MTDSGNSKLSDSALTRVAATSPLTATPDDLGCRLAARFALAFTLFGVVSYAFFAPAVTLCYNFPYQTPPILPDPSYHRVNSHLFARSGIIRDISLVSPSILPRASDKFLDAFDPELGVS